MELAEAWVCEQLLAAARQHMPRMAARPLSTAQAARPFFPATPLLAEAAEAKELQAAQAALASVRAEAAAVGWQLLPLRSPAELATLLQVELLYPLQGVNGAARAWGGRAVGVRARRAAHSSARERRVGARTSGLEGSGRAAQRCMSSMSSWCVCALCSPLVRVCYHRYQTVNFCFQWGWVVYVRVWFP